MSAGLYEGACCPEPSWLVQWFHGEMCRKKQTKVERQLIHKWVFRKVLIFMRQVNLCKTIFDNGEAPEWKKKTAAMFDKSQCIGWLQYLLLPGMHIKIQLPFHPIRLMEVLHQLRHVKAENDWIFIRSTG